MASALVLAACGSNGGSTAPARASAPAATAAGSAPAGESPAASSGATGAITVTSLWGGSEQESFQKVLDAFNA